MNVNLLISSDCLRRRVAVRRVQAYQPRTRQTHGGEPDANHDPARALPRLQPHRSPEYLPKTREQDPAREHHQVVQPAVVDPGEYRSDRGDRTDEPYQGGGRQRSMPAAGRAEDAAGHRGPPGEAVEGDREDHVPAEPVRLGRRHPQREPLG